MSKEREILRRSPQIFENNPVLMAITSMPEIIFAEVNDASPYNGTRIRFTFSAGVADSREFDRVALTIGDIIEKADNRLYQAKKTGKIKWCFVSGSSSARGGITLHYDGLLWLALFAKLKEV